MFVLQSSHNLATKGCERTVPSRRPGGVGGLCRWVLAALGSLAIVAGAGCSGVPDEEEAVTDQIRRLFAGGRIDRERPLPFSFDGRSYVGYAGDTLASALLANGVKLVGRSFKYHRPRGVLSARLSNWTNRS